MKNIKWYAVGAGLLLCAAFFAVRSCRIDDKYSVLKGENNILKEQVSAVEKVAIEQRAEADKVIAEKDKAIAESDKTIVGLKDSIGAKNAALAALDKNLAAAKTDAERVPILTSMVETWKGKYAALEGVVAEKDTQLAAWAVKYAQQVDISSTYRVQYEAEHRLRLSGETLLGKLETKYKVLKFTSSVKSMVVIATAGFIGYTLIKKGK